MKLPSPLLLSLSFLLWFCAFLCVASQSPPNSTLASGVAELVEQNSTASSSSSSSSNASTFGGGRYPSRDRRPPDRFIDNLESMYGQSYIDMMLEGADLEDVLAGDPEDGTEEYDGPGDYEDDGWIDLSDDPNSIWLTDEGDEEWLPGDDGDDGVDDEDEPLEW